MSRSHARCGCSRCGGGYQSGACRERDAEQHQSILDSPSKWGYETRKQAWEDEKKGRYKSNRRK